MAGLKGEKDEKTWTKAKLIVARQRNKDENAFSERDFALAHRIFNNMVKASMKTAAKAGDVHVLLARVEHLLEARESKKDKNADLPEDVRILVEALSMVMASGGQTIAALRSTKKTAMKPEDAEKLAAHLHATAKTVGRLLEKLKGE